MTFLSRIALVSVFKVEALYHKFKSSKYVLNIFFPVVCQRRLAGWLVTPKAIREGESEELDSASLC
jgi:hypothetical protein